MIRLILGYPFILVLFCTGISRFGLKESGIGNRADDIGIRERRPVIIRSTNPAENAIHSVSGDERVCGRSRAGDRAVPSIPMPGIGQRRNTGLCTICGRENLPDRRPAGHCGHCRVRQRRLCANTKCLGTLKCVRPQRLLSALVHSYTCVIDSITEP